MEAPKSPFEKPDSPGTDQSAGNVPSSATGIFGQVSAAPLRTKDDLFASLLKKPMPSESNSAPAPAALDPAVPVAGQAASASTVPAAPSASQGEFTRMLQALNSSVPAATSGAEPAARPSEELAKAFSHVALERIPNSEPAVRSEGLPVSPSAPGSFTQMFKAASGASASPAAGQVQTSPAQPQSAQPASGSGEFTKTFQEIKAENVPPVAAAPASTPKQPPQAGPGAFTRMFSNQGASPSPQEDPLNSLKPVATPESGMKLTGGAAPSAGPALPAQGGFTQLLRALNQEAPQAAAEPPIFQASSTPPAPAPSAGGFTQLLKALSAEPASESATAPPMPATSIPSSPPQLSPAPPIASRPVAPPVLPPSQAAPQAPTGPGEFTRIISGSALRDLQSNGGVPVPPTASAPATQSGWAPPPMPQPPAIPPPPAQHFAPPAFAFPPAPAPTPPPVAASAPPQSTLQKYLPLILVLNVFLMLVIVLILVFALHHK
jgi:hypothetical protein